MKFNQQFFIKFLLHFLFYFFFQLPMEHQENKLRLMNSVKFLESEIKELERKLAENESEKKELERKLAEYKQYVSCSTKSKKVQYL